ncbi:alpha/beta hydrolase [Flavobacterium gelidilacus]|uniref:serine aminopeptidase domain-containing protein n=1 Tax=Flavobacterium gelidilacus TaxID=206041 RepID=UPI0003FCDD05|nr:alpha/beta hydrolase [Flavobacterium gelidilacus]
MSVIKTIVILLFYSNSCLGQDILDYEKKIKDIENYDSSDFEFKNSKENLKLFGTLIKPKKEYDKIVIIVPGSGMDTRNSHYLLSQSLLEKNIAVFRYDERGVGKSDGKYNTANYTITDMTDDLIIIYDSIRKNSKFLNKRIGLISHSQGGMVTMGLLEKNIQPDFLIQWSTPVQKNGEFLKYQLKTGINKFEDELIFDNQAKKLEIMDIFHNSFGGTSTENDWKEDLKISKEALNKAKEKGYTKKNYNRFYYCNLNSLKHIVKKDFENIYKINKIPMLYIIGSEDKYIDPISETNKLESFNNDKIKIIILKGLNHYLNKEVLSQKNMYEIDETAKDEIISWIQKN